MASIQIIDVVGWIAAALMTLSIGGLIVAAFMWKDK